MAYTYDPEVEEDDDDDGYSIPKILVAVLMLVLVGAGAYIVIQNKQVKSMFQTFEQQKKSIESELDQMVLKYNLAIDDNGSLSNELKAERDKIIRFRDSIKRVKGNENSISIEEYNTAIKKLKESSSIVFDDAKKTTTIDPVKIESSKQTVSEPASQNAANNQNNQVEATKEVIKEQPKTEVATTTNAGPQTFERVEVPPTYPGCSGDATQKKACFNAQVKKAIAGKFDPDLAGNLNLPSGNQRVMVTFTVDKFGNVSNISAAGPHPKMEAEAVKVTKTLPKMTPARQNGVPVDVTFKVPITFKIE